MTSLKQNDFFTALDERCGWIKDYILSPRFVERFHPEEIRWAVTAYVRYGGKRLRPAILLFSTGAVGGDEKNALPAAAAVEIFHTWTLVHDDIIDRDPTRRGNPTVHQYYTDKSIDDNNTEKTRITPEDALHYGISLAILTGDIQHGWGISMMSELTGKCGVNPYVTLDLIEELDTNVLNTLVEGEVLDIQFARRPVDDLTPSEIESMLWKKTGALYEFCGRAGAMIGLGGRNFPEVNAISRFAALCGTAFQLQDDILGVIGDAKILGKPIGSDLREGKKTLVVHSAWQNATDEQKNRIRSVLGNSNATEDQVRGTINLLRELGGVDNVAQRAKTLIEQALPHLDSLPPTRYRDLLAQWADFMVSRKF